MRHRIISFLLVLVLALNLTIPVSAEETNNTTWTELLETATVNDSGNNVVTFSTTSYTFSIATPQYMRCTKVDMLIAHPAGSAPSSVRVRYNNVYYTLTMAKIDAYTTRVYGANIPDTLYADLVFQFNKSGTSSVSYQILSCRVTSITATELPASAYMLIDNVQYTVPYVYDYGGDGTDFDSASNHFAHFQFPIMVTDWQKYDAITISGSLDAMALNSVRCMIGGLGLPYEISYAVSNSSGSIGNIYTWNEMKYYTYDESYKGTSESETFVYDEYLGKTLFTVTIDLTGVDRTSTELLKVYFTCLANQCIGYTIQILGVTGTVRVADTSEITLWSKLQSNLTTSFNTLTSAVSTGFANVSSWISSQTSSLLSAISTGFTNVGTWISDQTGYLLSAINTGFTNTTNWLNRTYALIGQSFGELSSWMEKYFGQDDAQAEEFQDDAAQKGDEIEDLNNQLQEVTKPPVSDIETNLDDYVDPGTVTSVSTKLGVLTGDPLIVSMLMITLTVALVSYILFGKR